MMPVVQIISFLYTMETGKNGGGVSKREGEIEREKLIKGVGDRA
jgi:hypothetical protein